MPPIIESFTLDSLPSGNGIATDVLPNISSSIVFDIGGPLPPPTSSSLFSSELAPSTPSSSSSSSSSSSLSSSFSSTPPSSSSSSSSSFLFSPLINALPRSSVDTTSPSPSALSIIFAPFPVKSLISSSPSPSQPSATPGSPVVVLQTALHGDESNVAPTPLPTESTIDSPAHSYSSISRAQIAAIVLGICVFFLICFIIFVLLRTRYRGWRVKASQSDCFEPKPSTDSSRREHLNVSNCSARVSDTQSISETSSDMFSSGDSVDHASLAVSYLANAEDPANPVDLPSPRPDSNVLSSQDDKPLLHSPYLLTDPSTPSSATALIPSPGPNTGRRTRRHMFSTSRLSLTSAHSSVKTFATQRTQPPCYHNTPGPNEVCIAGGPLGQRW
ncbi:unnamed protein product [Somion occarium]|uniref:Uncharacterized protein n=1 Tax=Somion occarium TaxID=3059160 RepID=A0ABP1DSL0_9APHY